MTQAMSTEAFGLSEDEASRRLREDGRRNRGGQCPDNEQSQHEEKLQNSEEAYVAQFNV
jgi:hypothetical protein